MPSIRSLVPVLLLVASSAQAAGPEIVSFTWTPTRTVRDRVIESEISFDVRPGAAAIARASVHVLPRCYPELETAAFPVEVPRELPCAACGGSFRSRLDGLAGGREYDLLAAVTDDSGERAYALFTTPYLREYENLGARLAELGLTVSASYMPFDYRGMETGPRPLLGAYDPADPIVQWRHIDWASGAGINTFWVDWTNWAGPSIDSADPFAVRVIEGLLAKGGVKIGLMLGAQRNMRYGGAGDFPSWGVDLSNPVNAEILLRLGGYAAAHFLGDSDYVRVVGRPAFFIWDEGAFFNQSDAYNRFRDLIADSTGAEPYLIAHNLPAAPVTPADPGFARLRQDYREEGWYELDAYSGWIGFWRVAAPEDTSAVARYDGAIAGLYADWEEYATADGKDFVSTVAPGFDNSRSGWGPPQVGLPRSPERFRGLLMLALAHTVGRRHREIRIDTWNDFWESSFLEPSAGEGFAYLAVLRETLAPLVAFE